MGKLRVFLADDHAVVRAGLRTLINAETDMHVVGEAENGRDALDQIPELSPDIAVFDVNMPELNGAQATRRLKEASQQVRVLALTVHEDKSHMNELLAAGATGYLLKRAAATELINAIRAVAAGGVYIDPRVAGKLMDASENNLSGPVGDLSRRETEVLKRVAEGYSHKEIAAHLEVSMKTVETYKTRAMDKLNLRSRVDVVRYAVDAGWLRAS